MVVSNVHPVKRRYSSALREEQARATRRGIVAAAADLFVTQGYGATTIDAIAAAAGVNRKTVFTSVGSKLEALRLAYDWAIAGDDLQVPFRERPSIAGLRDEPDATAVLRRYAHIARRVCERVAAVHRVIESAAGTDAGIRELAEQGRQRRLEGMRELAAALAERGALRDDLTRSTAGDLLWLFNDPQHYHRLVIDRGWSAARYEHWLAQTVIAQVIRPDYEPAPD